MGIIKKWPVPSIPLAKHQLENSPRSISQPKQLRNQLQQPVASKSPIAIAQEPLLSVKSANTKRALNSSSANFHSNASSVRSLKNTRVTSASKAPPSLLSKRPPKLISLDFSKIPTSAPSTQARHHHAQRHA